ncbi:hypothetical protein [Hymenobacter sp. BRD67]|uniref:hypothetical protein n=1 Tax=Hymenobacter sp. BRD67 TaxID=2675877 RepID=UPI001566E422|nr:hypothetical protein [Hymenobacter sp. BRD67]QKG51744.1 hypothetical protein GKZ67_02955 [Hymenobacter sp. BRD67]
MRNPFEKPHSPGQWLLGSICWAVACIGAWVIIGYTSEIQSVKMTGPILYGCFWPLHFMIWWQAVRGGLYWLRASQVGGWLLNLTITLWLFIVVVFQVAALIAVTLITVFAVTCWRGKCIDW